MLQESKQEDIKLFPLVKMVEIMEPIHLKVFVLTCPAVPSPGIAMTVLCRDPNLGLISFIDRTRLLLFWAFCCRLTCIYEIKKTD